MIDGPYRDGKVWVMADRCSTCVFRPGNLMRLRSGRLKDLVQANLDSALTCHQTIPGGGYDVEPSVCRGFFDAHPTTPLQLAVALDCIAYTDPPTETVDP